jgi:hypothetical protein
MLLSVMMFTLRLFSVIWQRMLATFCWYSLGLADALRFPARTYHRTPPHTAFYPLRFTFFPVRFRRSEGEGAHAAAAATHCAYAARGRTDAVGHDFGFADATGVSAGMVAFQHFVPVDAVEHWTCFAVVCASHLATVCGYSHMFRVQRFATGRERSYFAVRFSGCAFHPMVSAFVTYFRSFCTKTTRPAWYSRLLRARTRVRCCARRARCWCGMRTFQDGSGLLPAPDRTYLEDGMIRLTHARLPYAFFRNGHSAVPASRIVCCGFTGQHCCSLPRCGFFVATVFAVLCGAWTPPRLLPGGYFKPAFSAFVYLALNVPAVAGMALVRPGEPAGTNAPFSGTAPRYGTFCLRHLNIARLDHAFRWMIHLPALNWICWTPALGCSVWFGGV